MLTLCLCVSYLSCVCGLVVLLHFSFLCVLSVFVKDLVCKTGNHDPPTPVHCGKMCCLESCTCCQGCCYEIRELTLKLNKFKKSLIGELNVNFKGSIPSDDNVCTTFPHTLVERCGNVAIGQNQLVALLSFHQPHPQTIPLDFSQLWKTVSP